ILRKNRDAIAASHAQIFQAEGHATHPLEQRVVRDRLIASVSLYLERIRPSILLDGREEELIERTGRGIPRTTRRHHRRPLFQRQRPSISRDGGSGNHRAYQRIEMTTLTGVTILSGAKVRYAPLYDAVASTTTLSGCCRTGPVSKRVRTVTYRLPATPSAPVVSVSVGLPFASPI